MNARLSPKHTIYLSQIRNAPRFVPWSHKVPGTWVAWALDSRMEIVPNAWSEVGFGDFLESYKRHAYDAVLDILKAQGESQEPIQFNRLRWEEF